MSRTVLSIVEKQVRRVRRRLFLQDLIKSMLRCWAGALLLTAAWVVGQRLLWPQLADWVTWAIPAGFLLAFSVGALAFRCWRPPSLVSAALALDQRFALKERVTTLLTLSPEQEQTPAGQALHDDAERQVTALDVPQKFPLGIPWPTAWWPVGTAALAVAAFILAPQIGPGGNRSAPTDPDKVAQAKELQEQLDKLKKTPQRKVGEDLPKSDQLKEIEAAWEKLLQKPVDPNDKEQIRERIQEMRNLQEKMKERIQDLKGLANKNKDVKKALEKLASMNAHAKNNTPQDGPAKELQDALQKGQLDKAKEEIDRLSKKLQDKQLSQQEKDKLAQQLQDLHDKLQRLVDQQDLKDQLQRDFDLGKISKDELARELEKLAQEIENLQDLQDLADLLKECKDCLGDGQLAAKKLRLIRAKLEELELDKDELEELLRDQKLLEEACVACLRRLGRQTGPLPGTLRPADPDDPNLKAKNKRQKTPVDPSGELRVTGFSRGGTFRKVPAREVGGTFKQAVQEAPETLERQRIPPEAADMAKGYFQKLGGQKN